MENERKTASESVFEVDGIRLDPDNLKFKQAIEFALTTNENLYLTGKAGSGKTTFLKYLRKVSKKEMVVVAPTGVAAINAGGQTIHSFFKIKPSVYVPGDKRLREKAPKKIQTNPPFLTYSDTIGTWKKSSVTLSCSSLTKFPWSVQKYRESLLSNGIRNSLERNSFVSEN